jgi:opacity protein-like surface antigen
MKKHIFTILIIFFAVAANAQRLHVTAFGGFTNYQGDLQDKRFTLNQSHAAFGAGLAYEITDNLYTRANVTFGKISGDDKQNSKNTARNLNFTSSITDIHLGAEYYLLSPYNYRLTPYVFAGISYFSFNPYTYDTSKRKFFLQPLSTEGQGFVQGRNNYKLNQFAFPFGGGVKFSLSENIRVGAEVGLRKTNTDYLDDVSTEYADQTLLLINRGTKAVELAFRGNEIKSGEPYPAGGAQRGSAKNKDWYYFGGLTLDVRLNTGSGNNRAASKSKTGCPRNIY